VELAVVEGEGKEGGGESRGGAALKCPLQMEEKERGKQRYTKRCI